MLNRSTAQNYKKPRVLNCLASFIGGILLLFYVLTANEIAANNYKLNALSGNLSALNEETANLFAGKNSLENSSRVLEFALGQNMIEARQPVYLFENKGVAVKP
ncbi:MAG: hypothetical protein A2746_01720 [Candidatus Yanofskybacteria bacterium RIFCSPHIGHO2_01_FULL_44_22]|uniref:Cell division protein FtsL n=1 Tax=Candidatus Yanofskybacteria bacterium RIFCSPHIGHO2_01_FULL_44_22 TaxID=1802669 RepID=A0A1F8ETE7_9BACT|nr:MAG: hypothetical protein A2746_01720 [Candidatus Yanofskybacteria bacterium RIFCSPHIGHO2_01_FULL_44_22]